MRKYIIIFISALSLFFTQCSKDRLTVDYLMEPDREAALSNPSDLINLLKGGFSTLNYALTNMRWVHINGWADQTSVTNAYLAFWDYCIEPRLRVNNTTTWDDKANIERFWTAFNAAISSANEIIGYIEVDGNKIIDDNDEDVTDKSLAGAYFVRGIAMGYIGLIYDQGFRVTPESDLTNLELEPYAKLTQYGVEDLIKCADIIGKSNADFEFDYFPGSETKEYWIQLAYSYAAKIMAHTARNATEAAAQDWNTILSYAKKGITEDWSPISTSDYFNNYHGWVSYPLNSGAPYLQVDVKIPYLMSQMGGDGSYPNEYPSDPNVLLAPVTTTDNRVNTDYWYTDNFGYLRESRGRYLFSNYGWKRYQFNYPNSDAGNPMHILDAAEMTYIMAEANVMLGNNDEAMNILNNSPYVTRGGYAALTDNSKANLMKVIAYEYAVELFGSPGVNWFAMRRWNMLKVGTAMQYPIPASELEVIMHELYSFGGAAFADGTGTSKGENAWGPIHGSTKSFAPYKLETVENANFILNNTASVEEEKGVAF